MEVIIIIVVVLVILYYIGKSQQKNQNKQSRVPKSQNLSFQSKIPSTKFPDRINAISFHFENIQKGLQTGDVDLANLSYAKLYESIRQQNINENGRYEDILQVVKDEYKEFRNHFDVEYPQEFLPPEEKKKIKEKEFEKDKNLPVYLETGNYNELPRQILKYVDIVKPVSDWYETGLKPKKDKTGNWKSIKRNGRYFGFYDANLNKQEHKTSLETGKRITKKPFYIKALIDQGIPITEFVAYGDDLESFVKAVDFFDNQEFAEAQKEIDKALEIKSKKDYKELKEDIELKLNNEKVVDEQFEKYKFDLDTAIHTGMIDEWIRVLINNQKYGKVIDYINKTNETLTKLAKGEIKPKIYGKQSSDWYEDKKETFNKNLIYTIDPKNFEISYSEDSVRLLELFLKLYDKDDFKPIEKIADIFTSWHLNQRAQTLYKNCLDMIENKNKPGVKKRIEKKIDEN